MTAAHPHTPFLGQCPPPRVHALDDLRTHTERESHLCHCLAKLKASQALQVVLKNSYQVNFCAVAAPGEGGHLGGKLVYLRGQKIKKLPKMPDLCHFPLLTGGQVWGWGGAWGENAFYAPLVPPFLLWHSMGGSLLIF